MAKIPYEMEERAAIKEFDGKLPRKEAEKQAWEESKKLKEKKA